MSTSNAKTLSLATIAKRIDEDARLASSGSGIMKAYADLLTYPQEKRDAVIIKEFVALTVETGKASAKEIVRIRSRMNEVAKNHETFGTWTCKLREGLKKDNLDGATKGSDPEHWIVTTLDKDTTTHEKALAKAEREAKAKAKAEEIAAAALAEANVITPKTVRDATPENAVQLVTESADSFDSLVRALPPAYRAHFLGSFVTDMLAALVECADDPKARFDVFSALKGHANWIRVTLESAGEAQSKAGAKEPAKPEPERTIIAPKASPKAIAMLAEAGIPAVEVNGTGSAGLITATDAKRAIKERLAA